MSSPRSDAIRAADLLEREELLHEEARSLISTSYRRRCEIESEIAEIHRLLQALGLADNDGS